MGDQLLSNLSGITEDLRLSEADEANPVLTISRRQMAVFDADIDTRFLTRAGAFLRHHAAKDVAHLDGDQLAAFVGESRAIAAQHGVNTERGIVTWALLRVVAGADFHKIPQVSALFAAAPGDRALKLLLERVLIFEPKPRP